MTHSSSEETLKMFINENFELLHRNAPIVDSFLYESMNSASVRHTDTLYALAARALGGKYSRGDWSDMYRMEIGQLPLEMRLDVMYEMRGNLAAVDTFLEHLTNPGVFSAMIRDLPLKSVKLVSCLQWFDSVCETRPAQLTNKYKMAARPAARSAVRSVAGTSTSTASTDFRCGLRIAMFLADAGWYSQAVPILKLSLLQTVPNSDDELLVLTELVATLAHMHSRFEICPYYRRLAVRIPHSKPQPIRKNLLVSFYYALSMFHFGRKNYDLSYFAGVHALELLDQSSPARLVLNVYRQLARACFSLRSLLGALLLLKQAIARAGHEYGLISAPYAKAVEDYAFYLRFQHNTGEALKVYPIARGIYLQLYGSQNESRVTAQGSLTFGFSLQALGMPLLSWGKKYIASKYDNLLRGCEPGNPLLFQFQDLIQLMNLMCYTSETFEVHNMPTVRVTELTEMMPIDEVQKVFKRC